jgi:hypothetical protein
MASTILKNYVRLISPLTSYKRFNRIYIMKDENREVHVIIILCNLKYGTL